ncbi:hypothetical protein Taro_029992 [Colocasia esculenta]|uniref:Uncharacterized protein n=1 Tax=Colocasia esculenta TaxID=4460 RepID=A0A843VYV1_COLES|nr:hypothetical protein [Colocasia esculenta]
MSSEQGDDVWGDEDFLNALIQATEDASAAALSSGGAPSTFPRDPSRPAPPEPSGNPMAAASADASWYSPFERLPPASLPPLPPVLVAPTAPALAALPYSGARAAWNDWDNPFADGNLAGLAFDGGGGNREFDFSPPRELSQREKRTDSRGAAEERVSVKPSGLKSVGRGRVSAGGVRVEKEKDKEIERLKRELERVLKKLDRVEHEHNELQNDRSKKEKELECAFSEIMARDAELESLKKEKLLPSRQDHSLATLEPHCARISIEQDVQFPVSEVKGAQGLPYHVVEKSHDIADEPAAPLRDPSLDFCLPESYARKRKKLQCDEPSAASESNHRIMEDDGLSTSNGCFIQSALPPKKHVQLHHAKAVGIQTELDNSHLATGDGSSLRDISSKLLWIWGSPSERISGRHLVSRLLVSCSTDLYVLFRFIGIPSNINMEMLSKEFFDVALHDPMHSVQSSEAQKVSKLYSIMMKIRNDVAHLDDLLDILIELCVLGDCTLLRDNIVITQSRENMFQGERRIEALTRGMEYQETENGCNIDQNSVALLSGSFGLQDPLNDEYRSSSSRSSPSWSCWISLFQTMHKIVVSNTKANIQAEALTVMNLILLQNDPISERGKLGLIPSFTSVSYVLHKQVDLCTKRQAVKLLFLLLNCPKLLRIFCFGHNGENEQMESAVGQDEAKKLQESISTIPGGLADCMTHGGNCIQELLLSKEAIILLAFIASSGKSGFQILLSPISKQSNFLELLVKVLASQMDTQMGSESQDTHKERTALIREALILLNRLASHTVYSKPTLRVLTQNATMAILTVDVANRICQKMNNYLKHDSTKKSQMEAEIVDLARLFRTRILSYLGENSS